MRALSALGLAVSSTLALIGGAAHGAPVTGVYADPGLVPRAQYFIEVKTQKTTCVKVLGEVVCVTTRESRRGDDGRPDREAGAGPLQQVSQQSTGPAVCEKAKEAKDRGMPLKIIESLERQCRDALPARPIRRVGKH